MLLQANALRIPLADESVHCVVTSPPYWGLRSYFGTAVWVDGDPICDHFIDLGDGGSIKDDDFETPFRTGKQYTHQKVYRDTCGKCGAVRIDAQLGLEATIEEYCANMVAVFREVKRVLRSDGVCWINLGDAFLNKQLIGAPWRVAFALQADGWWLRSDCIWAKPNPMPESVTDRPTKSHEYIFLLTKSANYFYDADAVREPLKDDPETYIKKSTRKNPTAVGSALQSGFASRENGFNKYLVDKDIYVPAGRNLRSVWTIATAPYSGAHFATFAPALVERCIRAGTSERGACPECGKQWERETSLTPEYKAVLESGKAWRDATGKPDEYTNRHPKNHPSTLPPKNVTTGWRPTCTHDVDPIPSVIFDPFVGSGTTVAVAQQLGRRGVGIDLSMPYLHLARERTGAEALERWKVGKLEGSNGKGASLEDLPMFKEMR